MMISNVPCPCEGCTKRNVGCHGSCEEYKDFQGELERIRDNIYAEHKHDRYFKAAIMRSVKRGGSNK